MTLTAGKAGMARTFTQEAIHNAAASADLVGHLNLIHPGRIQVIGHQELTYLINRAERRSEEMRREADQLISPAFIVAEGLTAPEKLCQHCEANHIALLSTSLPAATVIDSLRIYLSKTMAARITRHGVFMDILGLGVLITGESGLGKSELGLELISRGNGLVADDAVDFSRIAPNIVEGRCPPLLLNMLEVRGIGLLDIKAIFGETAVRRKMRLRLIIQLVRGSSFNDYERLPLDSQTEEVLGVPMRKVILPVAAGRNLAVLVEAAVRNTVLQLRGIDSMAEFMERQHAAIRDSSSEEY